MGLNKRYNLGFKISGNNNDAKFDEYNLCDYIDEYNLCDYKIPIFSSGIRSVQFTCFACFILWKIKD